MSQTYTHGDLVQMIQSITSAATSVNQLPGVLKLINKVYQNPALFWAQTKDVLDYGGGKYDKLTDALGKMGVRNWILDTYNRSADHNALVRRMLEVRKAQVGICSNVLNVVKEPEVRRAILESIARLTEEDAPVFITVYEGNKSSRGHKTTKGWQANRPTKNYLREVKRVFPHAFCCLGGKLIIASKYPLTKS